MTSLAHSIDDEPRIALRTGGEIRVAAAGDRDILRVVAADGHIVLTIHLTADGPVLHFDSPDVKIQADGRLSLEAEQLDLHGRERVSISSGGDVLLNTPGDFHSHARIQNLQATLGNVNIRANDDVRINGERVVVNS